MADSPRPGPRPLALDHSGLQSVCGHFQRHAAVLVFAQPLEKHPLRAIKKSPGEMPGLLPSNGLFLRNASKVEVTDFESRNPNFAKITIKAIHPISDRINIGKGL